MTECFIDKKYDFIIYMSPWINKRPVFMLAKREFDKIIDKQCDISFDEFKSIIYSNQNYDIYREFIDDYWKYINDNRGYNG